MRILILGAGKMGSFFTDLLSFNHDVAVLEKDPRRMRFIYNAQRFTSPEEIADFRPELLINCNAERHAPGIRGGISLSAERVYHLRHRLGKDRVAGIL